MALPSRPTAAQASASQRPSSSDVQTTRLSILTWLVVGGVALYLALDILLQLVPPHYNLVRVPESDYVHGPYGMLMTVNFLVRGAFSLTLLAAIAISSTMNTLSRVGLALLGIWAVGAFCLALFPADPYGDRVTRTGAIHLVIALVAFLAITLAQLLLARSFARDPRWTMYATLAMILAALTAVSFLLLDIAPLIVHRLLRIGGLTERIFLVFALLWILITALHLRAPAIPERDHHLSQPDHSASQG